MDIENENEIESISTNFYLITAKHLEKLDEAMLEMQNIFCDIFSNCEIHRLKELAETVNRHEH